MPPLTRPQDYLAGLDKACLLAGRWGLGWNCRFRAALREQGLMLASAVSRDDDLRGYPDGRPYQAPRCYGEQDGWPEGSLVAWLPDGGQW